MVTERGNAGAGINYNSTARPDLPYADGKITPAHRPWCGDCKRTDRALDADDVCEQCARAVVTRAAQKERWAEAERLERAQQREEKPKKKRRIRRGPKPGAAPVRRPSKTTALFDDLGLPTIVVKRWALEQGLISEIRRGRVPADVAAAYLAARDRGEVA